MKKFVRILGIVFVLMLCAVYFLPAMQQYANIPNQIYIQKGAQKAIDLGLPVKADTDATGVISLSSETLEDAGMQSPLVISSLDNGKATIELSLFGVPVKTVSVNVSEEVMLIPGGQSIGVTLYTKGALVVGITGIEMADGTTVNPARAAGMLPGDVIISINGKEVQNAAHVTQLLEETNAERLDVVVDRDGRRLNLKVCPAIDYSDGKPRLGVWVRDSTAGVGTLTFIKPDGRWFGGLGHAITDLDTGSVLSVKEGEIYFSEVIQVNRGENGVPGEIKGYFSSVSGNMGLILKNTDFGIYGRLYDEVDLSEFAQPIPAAHHDEVKLGPAQILSTVDHEGVKTFDCEIIKTTDQSSPQQKSFVIRITDQELLDRTGGIVQGMSGSPVIQDGKLVGAVTHVFINNPTKGYGLYVDWMLEQAR